jgi:imidazolonepropionase-like amidohydrolase
MHCDGADGWRKAARKNLYYGTDNVKMVSSRGIASLGLRGATEPDHQMATIEELSAAVDEAHRRGKKAIAHSMGAKPIQNAIKAGIDTIVHGFYMDEETAEMMVTHNVSLEPTTMYPKLAAQFGEGKLHPRMVEKAKIITQNMKAQFEMLLDKGVTISFGTDGGGVPFFPHGTNARELVDFIELGMTPMAAIQSATKVAAETIGLGNDLGTIESGKIADIIIVQGDPLVDISVLTHKENILAVMRSGEMLVGRETYARQGLLE